MPTQRMAGGFRTNFQNKQCIDCPNETNHTHLNTGIRPHSLCISPVSTVSHGGQIVQSTSYVGQSTQYILHGGEIVQSISQHNICYMVVRSYTPPDNALYIALWPDRTFHQSTQYHILVDTVSRGGQIVHSTSHAGQLYIPPVNSVYTTCWSDRTFHQSSQHRIMVRQKACM